MVLILVTPSVPKFSSPRRGSLMKLSSPRLVRDENSRLLRDSRLLSSNLPPMALIEVLEIEMRSPAPLATKSPLICLGPLMTTVPATSLSIVISPLTTSQSMLGVGSVTLMSLVQVEAAANNRQSYSSTKLFIYRTYRKPRRHRLPQWQKEP